MTDESDYVPPKTPLNYISADSLQDLWGVGFTVIRRNTFDPDIYELADRVKRPGMARQWVAKVAQSPDEQDLGHFLNTGWRVVNSEDYPGIFAPFTYSGPVEVGGLALIECPQHKVDRAKQQQVAAAHKLVDDWKQKWGGAFSGDVTVGGERATIGDPETAALLRDTSTKTIETTIAIPRDMIPYIGMIFEERDALYDDLVSKWNAGQTLNDWQNAIRIAYEVQLSLNKDTLLGPTLNSLILPTAIENVRKRIAEEAASGQAS